MGTWRRCALLAVAGLLAAACGSGAVDDAAPGEAVPSGQEDFPVTIAHRFGTTEITEKPERVLSLGYQEHDTIFALGVEPVAVRYWYGDEDDVIRPWAEEAAAGSRPEILEMADGELNFEKIAALDPDLILGLYSGIDAEEYRTLSSLAPTVPQTAEYVDYGMPWQEATRTIGLALGRAERAQELVAEVDGRFEAVRASHPDWEGRSVVVATYGPDGLGAFASEDLRSRVFTRLGFEVPERIDEMAGDQFYATLSFEAADALEVDVVVWDQLSFTEGGRATVEADPIIGQLDATSEGRTVYLEGELEDAFAWNSVLSLPAVLDGLEPMLVRATDDDPATEPSPGG